MPLKTIHRSVFKELIVALALSLAALNFVIMTDQLISLTRRLASVGASLSDIIKFIIYLQPQTMLLTVPMSLMMAALLTYGRMSIDNEITAMKASGMSFAAISRPVFAAGACCFAASAALGFYISPFCSAKLREAVTDTMARRTPSAIEEGVFNSAFGGIVFFVSEKPSAESLKGIFMYDERTPGEPRALYAKSGRVFASGPEKILFSLSDGEVHILKGGNATVIRFGQYTMTLPLPLQGPSVKLAELTPRQLLDEAGRRQGADRLKALVEFWRRLAMPFASLCFMLLAPAVAMKSGRAGKLGGLAIALAIFTLYYAAMIYFENLAASGKIPPFAGAWGPLAAMLPPSAWLYRQESGR